MKKNIFSISLTVMMLAFTGFENLSARSIERAPAITYMRELSPEVPYVTGIHVFENGRVILIDKSNGSGKKFIFISKKRIRRLINDIVNKQKFYSISKKDIKTFQKSREPKLDASTTHITVWGRMGTHKLSIYDFSPSTKVKIKKMIQLRNIFKKLEMLLKETKKKLRIKK